MSAATSEHAAFVAKIHERLQQHLHDPASSSGLDVRHQREKFCRHACVVVILIQRDNVWNLVFTKRAATLHSHSGEVCYVGGKLDGDETFEEAGLREMEEEIGLPRSYVTIVGALDLFESKHNLLVRPVVACVNADVSFARFVQALSLNADEVESCALERLARLLH